MRIGAVAADLREVCLLADFTVGHVYLKVPRPDQLIPADRGPDRIATW